MQGPNMAGWGSRSVAMLATAVVCSSVVAACGPTNNADDDSEHSLTVTDSSDRELDLDTPVERVAILDDGTAVAMRALGVLDRLVGSHEALEDEPLWDEISDLPVVATYSETSYETLAEVDPDLVFSSVRAHGVVTDNEILDGFDITDFKLNLRRPELMKEELSTLGRVFGVEDRAQELVDFYTETEEKITERIGDVADSERPKVFVEYHAGDFNTGGPGSRFYEQIPLAGGHNIAEDIDDEKQVSAEWIAEQDPDVIIRESTELGTGTTDTAEADEVREELLNRPGLQETKAAETGNVYLLPVDAYSRPGYPVGIAHIAQWLYPDRFDDEFVHEIEDEFTELFYPDVDPPDTTWGHPDTPERDRG